MILERVLSKSLVCCLFLSICLKINAQETDTIALTGINFSSNSVILSIWQIQTKEMSMPGDEPSEFSIVLARKQLSEEDSKRFIQYLKIKSSYDNTRALLSHYNLVFEFWANGVEITDVYISTMTGNIDLTDIETESAYVNNCAGKLNRLVLEFIRKYASIEMVSDVGTDGLEQ